MPVYFATSLLVKERLFALSSENEYFPREFNKSGNGRQPVRRLSYTLLTWGAKQHFQVLVHSQNDDAFPGLRTHIGMQTE